MKNTDCIKIKRKTSFLFVCSLLFFGIGLFALGWTIWPASEEAVQLTIPAGLLPGAPENSEFFSLTDYLIDISWPRWVRQGEKGLISMRLTDVDPSPLDKMDTTQIVLVEPAVFPLQIDPPGETQTNLGDDQALRLFWLISAADQRGTYKGKLYVSFGFFDPAEDTLIAIPVAVVDLGIRVIGLWGMSPGMMTWFGIIALVMGGGLFALSRGFGISQRQ